MTASAFSVLTPLSNAFTSAFKKLDPVPQFKATARLGEFLNRLMPLIHTRPCQAVRKIGGEATLTPIRSAFANPTRRRRLHQDCCMPTALSKTIGLTAHS